MRVESDNLCKTQASWWARVGELRKLDDFETTCAEGHETSCELILHVPFAEGTHNVDVRSAEKFGRRRD